MMPDQPTGSFILLDDKKVENDKFKGSSDLFQLHGLTKVAEVVLAGNSKIENYVASLKHFTGLRKGQNMELAPLADLYPTSIKPDFAPLSPQTLANSFTFETGKASLTEAELGVNVDSRALWGNQGDEKPEVAPKPAAAPAGGFSTKIKLGLKKKT